MTMTTKEIMEYVAEWDELGTTEGYEVTELDSNNVAQLFRVTFNGNNVASFRADYAVLVYRNGEIYIQNDMSDGIALRMDQLADYEWFTVKEEEMKMKTVIKIIDNTQYNPELCNNGGAYSFTTVFTPTEGGYTVTYETSSEFPYCPLCGSFYTGDNCPCGMDHPEIRTWEQVKTEVENAHNRATYGGENITIRYC